MNIKHLSHEKLVQLAYDYGILIDYRMSSDLFNLYLYDGTEVECDPLEAWFFLRGLVRGYHFAMHLPDPAPTTFLGRRGKEGLPPLEV